MTRCPQEDDATIYDSRCSHTSRPSQFRGKSRYRLAGRTLRCVLESCHPGPCAMEPVSASAPEPAQSSVEERRIQIALAKLDAETWGAK